MIKNIETISDKFESTIYIKVIIKYFLRRNLLFLFFIIIALFPADTRAQNKMDWKYSIIKNKFNDMMSTSAQAITSNYKFQNDFAIAFKCSNGHLTFEVDVDTFITSKGDTFNFQYRVDKQKSKTIELKTLMHTNNAGNTRNFSQEFVHEIIKGQTMHARVIGWSNEFFDAEISLNKAEDSISRVFQDCLSSIFAQEQEKNDEDYSLNEFLNDFKKLTPKLQRNILEGIKKLMS